MDIRDAKAIAGEALKLVDLVESDMLAKSLRAAHTTAIATKVVKAVKVTMPRIGDIVGELDKSGELAATYTVARKPNVYTTIASDRTSLRTLVKTATLTKVEKGLWTFTR